MDHLPRPLSNREQQIVGLMRQGELTIAGIAQRLGLDESTIRTYLFRIRGKLQVKTREQLIVAIVRDDLGSRQN